MGSGNQPPSMRPALLDLPTSISGVIFAIAGIAAAIFVVIKLSHQPKVSMLNGNATLINLDSFPQLDGIPTVGSSSWLGSWWAGLTYLTNAPDILQKGYEKARLVLSTFHTCSLTVFQHKSAPFKVAELYHWTVVLSKREHVEELRRAPDDTLSFAQAANEASN